MDEPVADRDPPSAGGLAAAVPAPPSSIGDARELLDVDMDQLTRTFALVVTHRPTGRGGGGAVADVETADTVVVQDAPHR